MSERSERRFAQRQKTAFRSRAASKWPHSARIGGGAVAGDEIWDQQARARIVLGPQTLEQYRQFLPTGSAHASLKALTRFFSDEHEFEVQLILKRDDVPACDLSLGGRRSVAARLGDLDEVQTRVSPGSGGYGPAAEVAPLDYSAPYTRAASESQPAQAIF